MTIEIISGSPRIESMTYRVALHLQQYLKEKTEYQIGLIDVREHNLPPVQTVFTSVENTPEEYRETTKRMQSADAFILVTPEYNGSYTSSLKNLLDHFPKQHHKPFGIVTASPGAMGGIRAALQLQQLVFALFGIGSPYMLLVPSVDKKFNESGNLIDGAFASAVETFVKEYLWLAEKVVDEKLMKQKLAA